MSQVKDSLGKDLAAQQVLSVAESKGHAMHIWQFGEGRLHNKVVFFAVLLGSAKFSLEITETAVMQDSYGHLCFGVCLSFKAGCAPAGLTGESSNEGQRRAKPSTWPLPKRQEKCKPGLTAQCW